MPHVIIEYTANVEVDARIPELMRLLNGVLIGHADVFPTGLDAEYHVNEGIVRGAVCHAVLVQA